MFIKINCFKSETKKLKAILLFLLLVTLINLIPILDVKGVEGDSGLLNQKSVEKYKIIGVLGSGSFGQVFLAKSPKTNRKFAIKRVIYDPKDLDEVKSIEAEKKVFEKTQGLEYLISGNYEDGSYGALVYTDFKMPYYPNELTYYINDVFITITKENDKKERIKKFMYQLIMGVKSLHKENILHRDIKPENILVDDCDGLVLCDYGLSVFNDKESEIKINHNAATSYYRSPEVIIGKKPQTSALDVWSIGCTFYEMWTSDILFFEKEEANIDEILTSRQLMEKSFNIDNINEMVYLEERENKVSHKKYIEVKSVRPIMKNAFKDIILASYAIISKDKEEKFKEDDLSELKEKWMKILTQTEKKGPLTQLQKTFEEAWNESFKAITYFEREKVVVGNSDLKKYIKLKDEISIIDEAALDLLKKLLELDPEKRVSATEALEHDYFKSK